MVPPFDPYEAADVPLRAKEARLVAELDAVRKSRAAIAAARLAAGTPPAVYTAGAATEVSTDSKYKGMGLEAAAAARLAECDHVEQTVKQIWAALFAEGFSIVSARPEGAVNWALRKREKKVGDVILVGDGKWGMTGWYSAARVKEIRAKRTNASGRNHEEHVENTKAGIANARKTRLGTWGRRLVVTGEQMKIAYEEYQRGAKSKLQLARAANIVWPTFNLYWKNFEMENWRPGDPFPPPRRETPKESTEIKLENMWPRANGHANGHSKDSEPQLTLRPAE
jgi:hypothetical protein